VCGTLRLHEQTTAVPVSTMVEYRHLLTPPETVLASAQDPSVPEPDFDHYLKHDYPELNGMLLDTRHAEPVRTAVGDAWDPNPPHHLMDDAFWQWAGQISAPADATVPVCNTCRGHLIKDVTPRTAIANHNFLGGVPRPLQGLTFAEQTLIALVRVRVNIIKLQLIGKSRQRALKANCCAFPQSVRSIWRELTRRDKLLTPAEMSEFLHVIFVGNRRPTKRMLSKVLSVSVPKVRAALRSLHLHNRHYASFTDEFIEEELRPYTAELGDEPGIPAAVFQAVRHIRTEDALKDKVYPGYCDYDVETVALQPLRDLDAEESKLPEAAAPGEDSCSEHDNEDGDHINAVEDEAGPDWDINMVTTGSVDADAVSISSNEMLDHAQRLLQANKDVDIVVPHGSTPLSDYTGPDLLEKAPLALLRQAQSKHLR
jgi:hypothetical protein